MAEGVVVPYELLEPKTLQAVLEEFVSRDGTDYGVHEVDLSQKVDQVMRSLRSKEAKIVFDAESESLSIVKVGY